MALVAAGSLTLAFVLQKLLEDPYGSITAGTQATVQGLTDLRMNLQRLSDTTFNQQILAGLQTANTIALQLNDIVVRNAANPNVLKSKLVDFAREQAPTLKALIEIVGSLEQKVYDKHKVRTPSAQLSTLRSTLEGPCGALCQLVKIGKYVAIGAAIYYGWKVVAPMVSSRYAHPPRYARR